MGIGVTDAAIVWLQAIVALKLYQGRIDTSGKADSTWTGKWTEKSRGL